MKVLSLLFVFYLSVTACYAQSPDLHFKTYREKRLFVQKLVFTFVNIQPRFTADSLGKLTEQAKLLGDSELVNEFRLFVYDAEFNMSTPDDTTAAHIKDIIHYARENKLRYLEADAIQQLGRCYDNSRRKAMAAEQYIAAYDIYKDFSGDEFPPKQMYLYVLGGKFGSMEDYDNALKYLHMSLATHNPTPVDLGCPLYNNLGLCFRNMKRYDSAVYYFKLGYEYALSHDNRPYIGITIGNIGISYFLEERYDTAIPLLRQDIEISLKTSQLKNAINSMAILATIYNNRNNYDSSKSILEKADSIFQARSFWKEYKIAEPLYRQLCVAYAGKHNFSKAWQYADSALVAKDSVFSLNSAIEIAKAHDLLDFTQRRLESEHLQNQVRIAQLEIGKNRIVIVASIAGVTVLLIVLLFISRLNKQITGQKKELESLNDVKNKIFSIISHDLRTPVNSLVSFTQLLEHGSMPPEKLVKYAGVLKDNLGYTAELMENLLNWARSQMQGYKPVFERFDIGEIAHQAVGLLTTEADKKGLSVQDNIPRGAIVFADINMASLIIRNLLSNAIKYTPAGGKITLDSKAVKDKILVRITDTGVGISPESVYDFNKTTIGQPLDSTPGTNKEKGTGLGLMLCKNFASLMHGAISVESEPGKGSTFTLALPKDN